MPNLRPTSEADLADMIRMARGPLTVVGGGTRSADAAGELLVTTGLAGVTLYEPGALTLVVRTGTALSDVQDLLASEGQRLPFEPPLSGDVLGRPGVSTIGGVVADNASGPRRLQVGACRDALIGMRMVDGHGTVIKNGGRVMKNVTGYDLVKLVAGSRGALGVISEVSFKVQAIPEAEATLMAEGLEPQAALAILRRATNSPYDISGAAHLDAASTGGASRTLIRIEGMAGSVAYRSGKLASLLGDARVITGDASADLWRAVRDVTPFAGVEGALWRLSVTPTKASLVPMALAQAGIAHRCIWDWAGGRLWLLAFGAAGPVIRAAIAGIGHARQVRPGPGLPPDRPEGDAALGALTAGLCAAFDPRHLFHQPQGQT
jgi:glycolate oxidase FAD binding subunit